MEKKKITDGTHKGKKRKSPHSFWTLCASQLSHVFKEIIYDYDLLAKCYTPVRSRDFDEEIIVEVTSGIPKIFVCDPKKYPNPSAFLSDEILSVKYGQPFLVISDVGGGKTTYLHHYFKVRVKEYGLQDEIIGIIIDLKKFAGLEKVPFDELREFINKEIYKELNDKFPEISSPTIEFGQTLFEDELRVFSRLIQDLNAKNPEKAQDYLFTKITEYVDNKTIHNRARIRYLVQNGKKISIVIDNVDQFGPKTQENIFTLCNSLMAEYKALVIMSARDYTMPSAFKHMPMSAYEPRFLHLALPDTKCILKKRVDFLFESKIIDKIFDLNKENKIEVESSSGKKYTFSREELQKEFDVILETLLKNEEVIEILENLSNYDIRYMLKMVRTALSSGYLFSEDRESKYQVKDRDFLRALMCGNNPHYFPEDTSTTSVINLFDNNEPLYEGNNLIRYRTLQTIKHLGNVVDVDDVIRFMESLSYKKEKVERVIQSFLDWDLVESPYNEGVKLKEDNIRCLKLTFEGEYYLNKLVYNDIYLSEIKNSTSISSRYLEEINYDMLAGKQPSLSKYDRIKHRLSATETFIEFLCDEEEKEGMRVKALNKFESTANHEKIGKICDDMMKKFKIASRNILHSVRDS